MKSHVAKLLRGELPPPPIGRTLGLRLVSAAEGRASFAMDVDPDRHGNPMGTVHGGILCDLADAAMGVAFATTLSDDESFTTLELKINFLRPIWRATLTADGTVTQRGRTVGLAECDITDESGRLVAKASSTCLVLRGEQAAGR
jgi:uncharacterized protein (TIGR00369 family)